MEFKKESQFTNNASKRVFEEAYFNDDMADNRANVSTKSYSLRVPEMFATNLSQEKAISPRRVSCVPNAHVFRCSVHYYDLYDSYLNESEMQSFDFTSMNLLEEILSSLVEQTKIKTDDNEYSLHYEYTKNTSSLSIYATHNDNGVKFCFSCPTYKDYQELWGLFNQTSFPFGIENDSLYMEDSLDPIDILHLTNVWSRENLFVHSSFSSSKYHYMCRTNDFFNKPTKYYYDNINNNEFEIYFTTDGINKVIPYDSVKIIELAFILRQFARF